MNQILWSDISKPAEKFFQVWVAGKELRWAEKIWSVLISQGFASYVNQEQKNLVYLRLLALVCIYNDFCYLYADEKNELDCEEIIEELKQYNINIEFSSSSDLYKILSAERIKIKEALLNYYSTIDNNEEDDIYSLMNDLINTLPLNFDDIYLPPEVWTASSSKDVRNVEEYNEELKAERFSRIYSWIDDGMQEIETG